MAPRRGRGMATARPLAARPLRRCVAACRWTSSRRSLRGCCSGGKAEEIARHERENEVGKALLGLIELTFQLRDPRLAARHLVLAENVPVHIAHQALVDRRALLQSLAELAQTREG